MININNKNIMNKNIYIKNIYLNLSENPYIHEKLNYSLIYGLIFIFLY